MEKRKLHRNVRPHLLRHSYAAHRLRGGAGVLVLQSLLDHECMATRPIYLRLVKEDAQNAYDEALKRVL